MKCEPRPMTSAAVPSGASFPALIDQGGRSLPGIRLHSPGTGGKRLLRRAVGVALGIGLAVVLAAPRADGQTLIAQWTFNAGNDASVGTGTTAPSAGTGTARQTGSALESYATGSSSDPEPGDNSGWNLSNFPPQSTGAKWAGAQFSVDLTGYQGIVVRFDWRASNTASRQLAVRYTINGTDWLDATSFTLAFGGAFTNGLTVDLSTTPGVQDNPNFAFQFVSDFASGVEYLAANPSSTYSMNGTWRFDMVAVTGTPVESGDLAPSIVQHPVSQQTVVGGTVRFRVVATGSEPLSYQWRRDNVAIPDATNSVLTLMNITMADAGEYRVNVGNHVNRAISDPAILTVTAAPEPALTDIAFLHTLLEPVNFTVTDKTNLYTVEGVVTTHTNLTSGANVLFYMQDATAGTAVFWTGGTNQFVPKAGDKVRVSAPLTEFNGLLELGPSVAKPEHSVTLLSSGNPLPQPRLLEFALFTSGDPTAIEPFEGSYVVVSNVYLDLSTPLFGRGGANITMTNEWGETFVLRADARTDIGGQAKPASVVTVVGVLGQFDTSNPRTSGYQIIPSRFADIIAITKAPTVRFTNVLSGLTRPGDAPTNTFFDHALLPGETLAMSLHVTDPEGRFVTIRPISEGLPGSARWEFAATSGADLAGHFTMHPTSLDAGRLFTPTLLAWNNVATNTVVWNVYVPTAAEQDVVLTEYLANPTSDSTKQHFNPLHRDPALTSDISINDEYIELANLSATDVELEGWTIADGVQVRHKFYSPFTLQSSNAVVVYGGPLNDFLPILDVTSTPASESTVGLALNNDGDTILVRNAASNLVLRLVYPGSAVSGSGSMTRYPDANSAFRAQTNVSSLAVTPGRQWDGRPFGEPAATPSGPIGRVEIETAPGGVSVTLSWRAEAGRSYSVWSSDDIAGGFHRIVEGLSASPYTDPAALSGKARFYRLSSP